MSREDDIIVKGLPKKPREIQKTRGQITLEQIKKRRLARLVHIEHRYAKLADLDFQNESELAQFESDSIKQEIQQTFKNKSF